MDVDVLAVPVDGRGRLHGERLERRSPRTATTTSSPSSRTGGTTNYGIVDDLAGRGGRVRRARPLAARRRRLRAGGARRAERAAPLRRHRARRLVHRRPAQVAVRAVRRVRAASTATRELGRAAHTQHAGYLDALTDAGEWNPSDYAIHLSRRARGLPFWFSLAAHGTDAYRDAVEQTLAVAAPRPRRSAAAAVRRAGARAAAVGRGVPPDRLDARRSTRTGPTGCCRRTSPSSRRPTHDGETVTRFAIVNPRTTVADILAILDTMA